MRPRLTILAFGLLLLPLLVSAREQDPSDESVVHGTINVALGNKNGLVVLTDSMLTAGGHQLAKPGQKLFKLDDRTVCAIAGFVSANAPVSDLNASTSAIIHQYVMQSARQDPQSIVERLRVLAHLFNLHLAAIANVRDAVGNATRVDDYRFQLIVAGFDLDNKPKIGRITLRTKNDKGSLISEVEDGTISNVEEKLVWSLNGMPDVAAQLLLHPESGPKDVVLDQYAASVRASSGGSLTVEQIVELAKRLAFYTSKAHPEVGGPNQIAVLQASHAIRIEQQAFADPPKPLFQFGLVVNSGFSYSSVAFSAPVVFVRCNWAGMRQALDGYFFIGNTFTDSVLTYGGGTVNLGNTNQVTNSVLLVGPLVRPDDETLVRMSKAFSWSRILRDLPSGTH